PAPPVPVAALVPVPPPPAPPAPVALLVAPELVVNVVSGGVGLLSDEQAAIAIAPAEKRTAKSAARRWLRGSVRAPMSVHLAEAEAAVGGAGRALGVGGA